MLLTVPQKYIKEIVEQFGAVKKSQAEKLLEIRFQKKQCIGAIRQLVLKKELRESGEYILADNAKITEDSIKAIDVMLSIGGENEIMQKGNNPFAVTFFKYREDKLWRYDICVVKQGSEQIITAALENIYAKYRVVVFVLDNPIQQEDIIVPCEYYFVWKENGEYHFYMEKR